MNCSWLDLVGDGSGKVDGDKENCSIVLECLMCMLPSCCVSFVLCFVFCALCAAVQVIAFLGINSQMAPNDPSFPPNEIVVSALDQRRLRLHVISVRYDPTRIYHPSMNYPILYSCSNQRVNISTCQSIDSSIDQSIEPSHPRGGAVSRRFRRPT